MMDFDIAVNKLSRNHSKQVRRNRGKNTIGAARSGSNSSRFMSEKAKREAEHNKRKAEEKRRVEKIKKEKLRRIYSYFSKCERDLGTVKNLGDGDAGDFFKPVSIHGEGDKITLPVSVLKTLMDLKGSEAFGNGVSPIEFRVGILNPDYKFPSSQKLIEMMDKAHISSYVDDDLSGGDDYDEEEEEKNESAAFLQELSHKYLSYTHCTVVEFTQEEGHIGIPKSVAVALLTEKAKLKIPVKRTVDLASPAAEKDMEVVGNGSSGGTFFNNTDPKVEDKTPGHLAWGEFDVPDYDVEVTLVKLPKGKGCTLTPTRESIVHGFHNLKDIKAVLEQSLIRTRATLTVNDTVHSWHRGTKFELVVSSVSPMDFSAVSCINTDIEVEFGTLDISPPEKDKVGSDKNPITKEKNSSAANIGRRIGSSTESDVSTALSSFQPGNNKDSEFSKFLTPKLLPSEPPLGQKTGVCTVQIKGDGKTGRRRFDTSSAISNLFSYAAQVSQQTTPFRLVTRFPRRVLELTGDGSVSLKDVGIGDGQELFIVEQI